MEGMQSRALAVAAAGWLLVAVSGCGADGSGEASISSIYVSPSSLAELQGAAFFDHPWPSDQRLEGGSPRFEGYYNPRQLAILDEYIGSMKGVLDGFSPAAAGFLRFTGSIDTATLPASPSASLDPASSVQLIDVDPASDERGSRRLITVHWREDEGVYWREKTLAFMPTFGFPLRPRTRYALVVTDALKAAGGGPVTPAPDLSAAIGAAGGPLGPAIAEIEAAGISRGRVVHLAVFTTNDPAAELFAVADDVIANVPPPTAMPVLWDVRAQNADLTEYTGRFGPSPNYQAGALPFKAFGDGGGFNMVGGVPQVVDLFHLRFSLSVPRPAACPMPAEGYPIVLYAHGTGGDYRSYVHDGTGRALAKQCMATMGVDQIFHGNRPGAAEGEAELLFFNFQNITAGRTNTRQAAIDEVQRARLFTESGMTVPATISTSGAEVRFDASRLMFFGHSQGGLNGPLFLAAAGSARGGVLSGSSSVMSITLLEKTKPTPSVAALVQSVFLGLKAEEYAELVPHHPAISLAQTIVDAVDPIHYAAYIAQRPRPGFAPKSIFMTEGINADGTGDSYSPPHGIEAHAIAMGLPLELPSVRPIVESAFGGPQPVAIPPEGLSGNLSGGAASGVLGQFAVPLHSDGHFVVFDVPAARARSTAFLRNLADDPKGRVPPP